MKIKINLIPPDRKSELKQQLRLEKLKSWEVGLGFLLLCFTLLLIGMYYINKLNYQSVLADTDLAHATQYAQIKELEKTFSNANEVLGQISQVQASQLHWSGFFQKLNSRLTPGVVLKGISENSYAITLLGTADTRDNLIAFKDSLSQEACFDQINLPLSDLVSKEQSDFEIDFLMKKECLK